MKALMLDGPLRGKVVEIPKWPYEIFTPIGPMPGIGVEFRSERFVYRKFRWAVAGRAIVCGSIQRNLPDNKDLWDLLIPDLAKEAVE